MHEGIAANGSWAGRARVAFGRDHRTARVAAVGTGTILLLAVLGVGFLEGLLPSAFDLDAEGNVPAAFSGLLLLAGAGGGFVVARRVAGWERVGVLGLAAMLGLMAFDEVFMLHERLERVTGIHWQLLYLPLIAAGAVGWLLVMRLSSRRSAGAPLLVGAAACWVAAQVLERLEWYGGKPLSDTEYQARLADTGYQVLVVIEETLEMTGSLLFLVTFLVLRALLPAGRPEPRPA